MFRPSNGHHQVEYTKTKTMFTLYVKIIQIYKMHTKETL
jgi:hypothetical protein